MNLLASIHDPGSPNDFWIFWDIDLDDRLLLVALRILAVALHTSSPRLGDRAVAPAPFSVTEGEAIRGVQGKPWNPNETYDVALYFLKYV